MTYELLIVVIAALGVFLANISDMRVGLATFLAVVVVFLGSIWINTLPS